MTNKFFFSLIAFLIIATGCFAQDTIFMRDDQRIACKVFEVSPNEVKYKKLELSDGPFYTENKSSIDRIKYKNGVVEIFLEAEIPSIGKRKDNHTSRNNYRDLSTIEGERTLYMYDGNVIRENGLHAMVLSLNNPKLTEEVRRAKLSKNLSYIGFLAIPLGIVGAGLAINAYGGGLRPYFGNAGKQNGPAAAFFLSAAALSISATFYFDGSSRNANVRAIQLYRKTYLSQ